jgi:uncharacterized membrane protein YfcA
LGKRLVPDIIYIITILFFSTIVRSAFGFGDALIAMPLLVMIVGLKVATPLFALMALTLSIAILIFEHKHLQLRNVASIFIAVLIGIPIGFYLLIHANEQLMKLLLAAMIISFVLFNKFYQKTSVYIHQNFKYLFGFLSGLFGGAYNTNGPPLVFWGLLNKWTPDVFRANLQGFFFLSGIILVGGHTIIGNIDIDVLNIYIKTLPFSIIALFVGNKIKRMIAVEKYNHFIYGILLLIGIVLFIKNI